LCLLRLFAAMPTAQLGLSHRGFLASLVSYAT